MPDARADGPLTAFTGGVGLFEQGHIFRQSCVRLGAGALQAIWHICSVFPTSEATQRYSTYNLPSPDQQIDSVGRLSCSKNAEVTCCSYTAVFCAGQKLAWAVRMNFRGLFEGLC